MDDDYRGYKALFAQGITELGCWAHARRKFSDVHKPSGSPVAKDALPHIGALYAIEAILCELTPEARGRERQRRLVPKLDALKRWLDERSSKVLGNTGLDKNNLIENAIRPIAIGRANSDDHLSSKRSAHKNSPPE